MAPRHGKRHPDLNEPPSLYPFDPEEVLRRIVQGPDKTTSDRTKPDNDEEPTKP